MSNRRWSPWILGILGACILGVCIFLIWEHARLSTTVEGISTQLDNVQEGLEPLATKADLTPMVESHERSEESLGTLGTVLDRVEEGLEPLATKADTQSLKERLARSSIDGISIYEDARDSICAVSIAGKSTPLVGTCFLHGDNIHVLTAWHVVEGFEPSDLYVQFGEGEPVKARIVKSDDSQDLVLLELSEAMEGRTPLSLADEVVPGQWVVAFGQPYGKFSNSLTVGVISGVHRITDDPSFFTSCPTCTDSLEVYGSNDPGTSGSPVLDLNGSVVGIKRARVGHVSLAISADTIRRFLESVKWSAGEERQ